MTGRVPNPHNPIHPQKSKKRMKRVAGSIDLPQEAFYELLSSKKAG